MEHNASNGASERLVVISSDAHAGAEILGYKPYLDKQWHDEFDAWAAAYVNPWKYLDPRSPDEELRTGPASADSTLNWDSKRRIENTEIEGIAAEVIFPNTPTPFVPDSCLSAPRPANRATYERRWAGLQAHNRWIKDFCDKLPGRRAGVAEILLFTIDDAIAEVKATKESGLMGGILLPVDGAEGGLSPIYDTDFDPLWAVCADLDVPVHRHARAPGSPVSAHTGPGGVAIGLSELAFWDHRALSHIIFSGALERHPTLKFVFTESGVGWIPAELAKLDAFYAESRKTEYSGLLYFLVDALKELTMSPSEYFARNIWVGASLLNVGEVAMRHQVGVDKLMWGQDYPHSEGTFPYTKASFQMLFGDVPEDEIRSMLCTTAATIYGFDVAALRPVADRIGPTMAEIKGSDITIPRYPEDTISPVFMQTAAHSVIGR